MLRLGVRCVFVCLKFNLWVTQSGWSVLGLAGKQEREENKYRNKDGDKEEDEDAETDENEDGVEDADEDKV